MWFGGRGLNGRAGSDCGSSYFGKQEGDFSLVLRSICARKEMKEEEGRL